MKNKTHLNILLPVLIMTFIAGCPSQDEISQQTEKPGDQPGASFQEIPDQIPDDYRAAETLAKRLVLYKLALQEGDLAPFTVLEDNIEEIPVPELARQINHLWWSYQWETTRLNPLPATEMSVLEGDVFPLISARIDEENVQDGWIRIVVGFDPYRLQEIVADAHDEWIPEEREIYMIVIEDGCFQVWCVKVNGEWKIAAHLNCTPDIIPPEPPE